MTLYKKNAAEFPPEAKEQRYLELLPVSYPIHPELFGSVVEGLGQPGEVSANARRSPFHGQCRRCSLAFANP